MGPNPSINVYTPFSNPTEWEKGRNPFKCSRIESLKRGQKLYNKPQTLLPLSQSLKIHTFLSFHVQARHIKHNNSFYDDPKP